MTCLRSCRQLLYVHVIISAQIDEAAITPTWGALHCRWPRMETGLNLFTAGGWNQTSAALTLLTRAIMSRDNDGPLLPDKQVIAALQISWANYRTVPSSPVPPETTSASLLPPAAANYERDIIIIMNELWNAITVGVCGFTSNGFARRSLMIKAPSWTETERFHLSGELSLLVVAWGQRQINLLINPPYSN